MAQMKLSVPLHIFAGLPIDIVVFGKRYSKMKMKRKTKG